MYDLDEWQPVKAYSEMYNETEKTEQFDSDEKIRT